MATAVIFPGQGSQSVGMLTELAEAYPVVGQSFEEASSVLGYDLWELVQAGPADRLGDTRFTQPAMFVAGMATWRVLVEHGLPAPAVVAGHSLGEFTALCAVGALSFEAAVALVKMRANLMAAAVAEGEGGMAALIGMEDDAVIALCEAQTGARIVEAVNFNAPGQVAISGHRDALERTLAEAKSHGAKRGVMLPVSVPNHSSLMREPGARLASAISEIDWAFPEIPIVQNAQATAPDSLDTLLASLSSHVHSPVYWTRTVEQLRDVHGVTRLIECGPGKVLAGLVKRIDRQLPVAVVDSPAAVNAALSGAISGVSS